MQQTFDALTTHDPKNVRWQSELGYAYDNLGKVALEQGQLLQAIAAYRDDQRIKAALAAQDPKNYDTREDLLVADAIQVARSRWAGRVKLRYITPVMP